MSIITIIITISDEIRGFWAESSGIRGDGFHRGEVYLQDDVSHLDGEEGDHMLMIMSFILLLEWWSQRYILVCGSLNQNGLEWIGMEWIGMDWNLQQVWPLDHGMDYGWGSRETGQWWRSHSWAGESCHHHIWSCISSFVTFSQSLLSLSSSRCVLTRSSLRIRGNFFGSLVLLAWVLIYFHFHPGLS